MKSLHSPRNVERSGDENKVKEAVNIICQNQTFKTSIYDSIQSKISSLEAEFTWPTNKYGWHWKILPT